MEKAVKDGGCSRFSQLPEDIVVQIYNKIMDLKTLCRCQLISKRLGLIVFQANTISFNVPPPIDYENENDHRLDDLVLLFNLFRLPIGEASFASDLDDSDPAPPLGSDSFPSTIEFIKRFTKLKSICIQFPSYVIVAAVDSVSLFQWKIRLRTRADSLVDLIDKFKKVLGCTAKFPLLEKVFIMGSNERGIVTLSGGEIEKLKNVYRSYGSNGTSNSEHLVYHSREISDT